MVSSGHTRCICAFACVCGRALQNLFDDALQMNDEIALRFSILKNKFLMRRVAAISRCTKIIDTALGAPCHVQQTSLRLDFSHQKCQYLHPCSYLFDFICLFERTELANGFDSSPFRSWSELRVGSDCLGEPNRSEAWHKGI